MKDNMIHFVCTINENKIIRIFKQRKRAENMINENIHVLSYNPKFYPIIENFTIGNYINEFQVEMTRKY